MGKKIYVGNLNFRTDEDQIADLFAQYGDVADVKVIYDRETQRSRGFGFVEMATDEACAAAVEALNNAEFDGRNLKVSEALERERRPRREY